MRQIHRAICAIGLVGVAMVGRGTLADENNRNAEAAFNSLANEFRASSDKFWTARRDTKTPEEDARLVAELYPGNTMVDEFLALEANYRGSVVGLSCLYHLVSIAAAGGEPEEPVTIGRRKALAILSERYGDHPDLDVFFRLLNMGPLVPETKSFLKNAADSSHRHVRANALLRLVETLKNEVVWPSLYRSRLALMSDSAAARQDDIDWYTKALERFRGLDPEASRAEAIAIMKRIKTDYGDVVESPRLGYGPKIISVERSKIDPLTLVERRPLSELIESMRFEIEYLSIGCQAPEIAGPDAFGKQLSLSENLGKVTVVMFSFKGCGPCEAMYPSNRKLIERFAGRSFAFVGVMGDMTVDTVKESIEQEKIAWPVWWDGHKGPISRRWNVRGWPEIYVLDHEGIIRYRGLNSELLAEAVAKLVAIAEDSQQ